MFLCEDKLHSARCCKTLSWLLYLVVNDFGLPLLVFKRRALPVVDFLIFRGEFGHHLCVHGGDLWKQMEIRAVLRDTQLVHLHLLLQLCPSTAPQTDHRLRDNGVCPRLTHPITLCSLGFLPGSHHPLQAHSFTGCSIRFQFWGDFYTRLISFSSYVEKALKN